MINRGLLLIFVALFTTYFSFSQTCGTYVGYLSDQAERYPDYYKKLAEKNKHFEIQHKAALKKMANSKGAVGKKRIIPVVVHNVYSAAGGYISDSEIQGAIDALNRNVNGQSDQLLELYQNQYIKTPDIFASVRGIANIEFRLAKWTPSVDPSLCDTCPESQPTTGINRIFTDITSGGSDGGPDPVKTLGYWNSYQYFNIWTVRSFSQSGLLGYAQFPTDVNSGFGFGSNFMSTDGVVLLSSEMRDDQSSTLTHEAGHWLGLRHIWGDAPCGDDGIRDTPFHRYDNNGASESSPTPAGHPRPTPAIFPYHVGIPAPSGQSGAWGCTADSLNPAGEMFMNYMDYTSDQFTTMFSAGQIEKINETLDGVINEETGVDGIGFREYMWSDENINLTGTADGYVNMENECSSKYDFFEQNNRNSVCLGQESWFTSNSKSIDVNVKNVFWNFGEDGASDVESDYITALGYYKKHTYSESGKYDVELTVEYDEVRSIRAYDDQNFSEIPDSTYEEVNILIVQGTRNELLDMGLTDSDIKLHVDTFGYSLDSYWIKNQLSADDLQDATFIETVQDGLTTYYNGYYGDTLFYRGSLEETIYVAEYRKECEVSTVKTNYVTIGDTEGQLSSYPKKYSFEDADDLSSEWSLNESQAIDSEWAFSASNNTIWKWTDQVSKDGNASIMIDKNQLVIGETQIISPAYDLSDLTDPAIKFSWSGASSSSNPLNELEVYYSLNCGKTFSLLGKIPAIESANSGMYTTSSYKPSSDQWVDTIMTKTGLKSDNVMFKFQYVVNGKSNNFYLDNIIIGDESDLMFLDEPINARLSLFPNPSKGQPTIALENISELNIQIKLVNLLGVEVKQLFDGVVVGDYYELNDLASWPKELETGVYFITVVSEGDIIKTEKLFINK